MLTWRGCAFCAAIPATVVAAASFDDAIAITGYTLFINLAVQGGGNTGWNVAHGPLSIVFGVLAGGLAGLFCSATKLWSNPIKRTFVMFLTGERILPLTPTKGTIAFFLGGSTLLHPRFDARTQHERLKQCGATKEYV